MADNLQQPLQDWTESEVSIWLKSIGVKEQYVKNLYDEEVNGQILCSVDEDYLKKEFCMKSGPAHLIIKRRDELINSQKKSQEKKKSNSAGKNEVEKKSVQIVPTCGSSPAQTQNVLEEKQTAQGLCVLPSKEDCKPRPFDTEGIDFLYVKHRVLQPESGAFDLISPCHEFKSLAEAAKLDRARLQAKFAKEVLKFATGCMNIRTNGTIHFGVMDSKDNNQYTHGEIIGVPVKETDIYIDALDYIERSFSSNEEHVRQCVRPPRFIEVVDREGKEKRYVVEVDIVPSINIVKNKVYSVKLPNFKDSTNKVEFEKATIYRRVGAKTEPVSEQDRSDFYERVRDRDVQREEAERYQFLNAPHICQDLGRKLMMLMTSGKKFIEKEKWFIFVTNKFKPEDLCHIEWLHNMNIFCVFDFDPDSKTSGLCSKYLLHHAANMHFLQSYRMPSGTGIKEFTRQLHLFEQTSWIFCNGRTDFKGNEIECDDMTWIKTKMTLLRESVSLISKQILPKGTFQVIFLLTSPVEKPVLHTFYEFFTDMEGHEDIICICESEKNFQKWKSFAEGSCGTQMVDNSSVVGMKMSHINATMQQIQPTNPHATKKLAVFSKGTCLLKTNKEEQMYSLEILTVDHCDETTEEFITEEKKSIEHQFYRGGRVTWLNFWLAEHKHVGEVIKRDAYRDVSKLLKNALEVNADQTHVNHINIYHHPGSGGSTVARQVLWNNRKNLRCAILKPSYSAAVVAQHAVEFREYEEEEPQRCVPVLLLIEDSDKEYIDDIRNELEVAINTKRMPNGMLCFILLSCRRSHDPEKRCKESPLQNVSVTHKLSAQEKKMFAGKREVLEEDYEPQFILTFVLMCEGFDEKYVKGFVEHLLQDINHESVDTRLIQYVALLNTYVQDSFISQSHCEALLSLRIHLERFRQHEFKNSLSDPAKLVFLHLKDDTTHIDSVRIIHPLIAKEILQQLLGNKWTHSSLAQDLLHQDVLFEHRFGREEYLSFLRALFIRRSRISRGDAYDSFFSPLIEHVCKYEHPDKAIEVLEEACYRFQRDPFFAQQLARIHYTYEKFEEAKYWAETAAKDLPHNSYILDTKGQVYRKWFQAKCKAIDSDNKLKTAENTSDAVETALKALECFQESEKAALADMESVNNSCFFAEAEVGCSLLKLISSLDVFSNKANGLSECTKYLLTDYIPEEVNEPWERFHGSLKNLKNTVQYALEWISEDLSYFQTDVDADEGERTMVSPEEKISHPLAWLAKKSSEYGKYFSEGYNTPLQPGQSNPSSLTPFQKRMVICRLGGGNVTSLLSKLTDPKNPADVLECILSLYPQNPLEARLTQRDIVNYIVAHIARNCLSPSPAKAVPLREMQALCRQFPVDKRKCLPSALFLLTLLFWPEDDDTDHEKEIKYETVQTAIEHLEKSYWTKMKDIPQRKRRIYTHFFLGNGSGLNKFVHKSKFESVTKGFSVSEKRIKWFSGKAWRMPEIAKMLKRVSGWTEDGAVYLEGPQKKKFNILPLYVPSVPHGNENIHFYLGFTFRGPVAYDIMVKDLASS